MKTTITALARRFLILLLCLALPGAVAAGGRTETEPGQRVVVGPQVDLESRRIAGDVIDTPVLDGEGSEIGRVDELLLDLSAGRITYFVLEIDELAGVEANRYPLPAHLIYPNLDERTVMFPVEQHDLLEFAPPMSDYPADERVPGWHFEVDTFWRRSETTVNARVVSPGYRPIVPVRSASYGRYTDRRGATVSAGPIYASSRLRGLAVLNEEGERLATVSDYVVALSSARLPYAVLDLEGNGSRAVPLPLFRRGVDSEPLIFTSSSERLDGAPPFEEPGLVRDQEWQERNLDYWAEIDVGSRYRYGAQLVPGLTLDSSDIVGYELLNTNNQTIGRVEDLIISREGIVLYAEASFGGFLGLGERRYAIPISALEVDPYHRAVVLDVPRDELEEIPPLEPGALPTTSGDWDESIRDFWRGRLEDIAGASAQTAFSETLAARQQSGALRAQWLIDYPVVLGDGAAGNVSNLLIDIEAPAVSYLVVELPPSDAGEARWIPVPADRIAFDPEAGQVRLEADEADLRAAPAYPFVERPGVTLDRVWMSEVDEYWGAPGDS